jgi:O-antigen ligase
MSAVQVPPDALRHAQARATRMEIETWGPAIAVIGLTVWAAGLFVSIELCVGLLTALGFGLAVLGLWRPALGLLGVALLCTLDPLMNSYVFTGGLLRWNTFNYWLLFVLVLFFGVLLRLQNRHVVLLECWLGLLGIELLISADYLTGMQDLFGAFAALGLLVYFARGGQQPGAWFWLAVISSTVAAGGSLSYFLRAGATDLINPNAVAFMPITGLFACCMGLPFAARYRMGQPLLAALAGLNFVMVVLTASRGSMITSSVCLVYLLISMRGIGRKVVVLGLVAIIGIVALSQFTDLRTYAFHRLNLFVDPNVNLTDATSGRADLAKAGLHMFEQNPLGRGTGGFATAWSQLSYRDSESGWGVGHLKAAHSGWIKILVENGLPGALLYGLFLLGFAVSGWRSGSRELVLLGCLATIVLSLAFLTTEYQSKGVWFIAAGVMTLLRSRRPAAQTTPVASGPPGRTLAVRS